jgi:hypothetical protein
MKNAYKVINYLEKRVCTHTQNNGKHVYVPYVGVESLIQKQARIIAEELQATQQLSQPVELLWTDLDDSTTPTSTKIQGFPPHDETNPL